MIKFNLNISFILVFVSSIFIMSCSHNLSKIDDALLRMKYLSKYDDDEKECLIYLPRGYYEQENKKWPVILFLHGNGERGNSTTELDFVLMHGPMYEAWVQKKNLPFIIIAPQLPMLGKDKEAEYLRNRDPNSIPKRLEIGVPPRFEIFPTNIPMIGAQTEDSLNYNLPDLGWEERVEDVILILDKAINQFNIDSTKVYLTGLSYGGFGTWYIASKYPHRFAAIAPIVGWGNPDLIKPIAKHNLPVWAFAGGRDLVVQKKYFFKAMNELERLGDKNIRFTIHEDMGHDTWKRVYAGDDLYNWFLQFSKK